MSQETVENRPVRLGLYGCNPYRTRELMDATAALVEHDVRVTACLDLDLGRAAAAAAKYGGAAHDHRDRFLAEDFDVAVICLPPYLHPEAFAACAAAGKDVYLEKPVCVDEAGKEILLRAMADHHPVCYVGISSPYLAPHRKALEIRRRPDAGEFIGMHHHRFHPSTGNPANPDNWRHRLEQSGGELNQHCCHDMHYLRLVAGEPESVYAMSYTSPDYRPGHEEEELTACFRGARGMAVFSMSQRSHRAHLSGQIHLTGMGIQYDWAPFSQVRVYRSRSRVADETYNFDEVGAPPPNEDRNVLQMRDFLDAYAAGAPMPITLADGIYAYEMIRAIRDSYRTRREVPIPKPLEL